jgi:hypothetical protein
VNRARHTPRAPGAPFPVRVTAFVYLNPFVWVCMFGFGGRRLELIESAAHFPPRTTQAAWCCGKSTNRRTTLTLRRRRCVEAWLSSIGKGRN